MPLLLPSAIAADLLLAHQARVPWPARIILVSFVFTVLFYAVQFPYSQFARPAWSPRLLRDGWQLALLLPPLAAAGGLLLGRWLTLAPPPGWMLQRRRQVSPA